MIDTEYWNAFYANASHIAAPSPFAEYVLPLLSEDGPLLDLGCGNGRDSLFFAGNGREVFSVDASATAIDCLTKTAKDLPVHAQVDDFVSTGLFQQHKFAYVYSRFTIHSIPASREKELLANIHSSLTDKLFIEVRSIHDDIYGLGEEVEKNAYIYHGHFRRFIDKNELEKALLDTGFTIVESQEARGFAPYKDEDPVVIRIVAKA